MAKNEFTSFDISAVVHELTTQITDSRVNNIYQFGTKALLLKLHKTGKPPLQLVLEAGRRLHLTAYSLEKPQEPPAFCMALRKHLRNAWLTGVEQQAFERIVTFHLETKPDKLRLILELFGEGNIILTNEKGEILQALFFKHMRDRNILRGEVYRFPPSLGKNPVKLTREEVEATLKECGDTEIVRAIARSLGVGGVYAEEILLRAGVGKTKRCKELSDAEFASVCDSLQTIVSILTGFRFEPRIILEADGSYLDVVPFSLKRYEPFKFQAYTSFNEALDEFYLRSTAAEKAAEVGSVVTELQREADKLKRVIAEQEKTVREALDKAEKDKRIGNAIYAHSVELQQLLDKFAGAKSEGKDWSTLVKMVLAAKSSGATPERLFESFDSRNLAINVCVGSDCFSLTLRKTLFENAAEYYERNKKAKQKASGAKAALEESRVKLAKVEQRINKAEAEQSTKPAEVLAEFAKRKVESKEWFEKFRWFTSSDGSLVVAGKDSVSNEVLIKKHTSENDVVFHAEITGAPFVVVKTEGKTPTEQTLQEAGEYAAAFSRAWREELAAVDVYWVKPDQLSKTGPSGEYVPHGAFAVVGKRNWMRGVQLRIAVGMVEDGEVSFIGGPVDAVKAKSKVYVIVMPGDVMGKELLRRVLHALSVKLPKENREKVTKTSVERIRELVPYTKGRLIETS